jgi:hypothetical protein
MSEDAIRMMMERVWISEMKSEFGGGCSMEDSESEEIVGGMLLGAPELLCHPVKPD